MIYFVDASALVKRYVREPGTDAVRSLFSRGKKLAASRITAVEVPAALARRARSGDLDERLAMKQAARVAADLGNMYLVELRREVVRIANELVWRHAMRAYDAVQLASALHLKSATGISMTFVCADRMLSDAAENESLRVLFT